jgi:outer membrane protein assembly factor BamB
MQTTPCAPFRRLVLTLVILLTGMAGPRLGLVATAGENVDWRCTGGDPGCTRYSALEQIDRDNVARLEVAWTYHTGEFGKPIECTPIVVDGILYLTTGELRVVALEAATGRELWSFDPFAHSPPKTPLASGGVNRGVAYWSDGKPHGKRRILHGTADGRLFSLDARSGQLDREFGTAGVKDLRQDLERDVSRMPYGPTSAPAVWSDSVIVGFSCGEGPGPAAPGDVRAFDVRTGKQLWRFHTLLDLASSATKRGLPNRGKTAVGSTLGADSASTRSGDWCSAGWDPRRSTSTAVIGRDRIYLPIAPWRSMPRPAGAAGTFRRCTMTCGTTISRSTPTWSA